MSVIIRGMEMPESCEECRWFHFRGSTSDYRWLLDARCKLIKPTQDWYADGYPDKRGGWIGDDIDPENKMGYYYYHHCVKSGTRAKQCPLFEVKAWEKM